MSKEKTVDLGLKTAFDELFMSDAGRAENRLPKIYDIPLSEIDDFPDHPFQVRLDDDMDALVQSVKERGIITPVNTDSGCKCSKRKIFIFVLVSTSHCRNGNNSAAAHCP